MGSNPVPVTLDFDQGKAIRDQQYEFSKQEYKNSEEDDPDDENEVQKSITNLPSQKVFQNKKKGVVDSTLEDFQLLKIVGKGTFGKVF